MNFNPMLGMPQGAEWLVILVVVVLIFGAAKLPELARGTGQALRIFKAETKGLRDDDTSDDTASTPPPVATPPGELPASGATDTATDTPTGEPRRDTLNG